MDIETRGLFFTDECNFDLNGSTYAWRRKSQRIKKESHTYAPKVQVWGAISVQGKAYLETFEGTMNAERYIEMLEERFIPVADDIMEESWTLQ